MIEGFVHMDMHGKDKMAYKTHLGSEEQHTSPLFVKKIMSPWLPLRCLWPSFFGMRMGVATSREPKSGVRLKLLENSPC